MAAFLGMRGTGNWATNQMPESWRETILYEYPNGSAPITAMMSMFKSETIDSVTHHWWTKTLPSQSATVTGVYINSDLSTAYVYATHQATCGIAGSVVFVKMAEASAKEFREGHTVVLKDANMYDVDIVGKVVDVVYNGASSYVAVKLLEADDNSATPGTYNLSTVDTAVIMGNINPQGSPMPRAVAYDPVEYYNYTQIWRTPLELTKTAIATKLRTGDAYKEAKRECLELHSIEMEKSAIWGIRASGTGANGKPENMAGGLLWFVRNNASSNVNAYQYNTDYSAQTWLNGGEDWLDYYLSVFFRYAPSDKAVAICGDGAMLGVQRLAKTYGQFDLASATKSYGIAVTEWKSVFGTVPLKTHPLFSHMASTRNSMLIYCPQNVRFMPLNTRDTKFETDQAAKGVDAVVEGFLTEGTYEFRFPNQFMYLEGVGLDSLV
jgi:hypothetical protein